MKTYIVVNSINGDVLTASGNFMKSDSPTKDGVKFSGDNEDFIRIMENPYLDAIEVLNEES